MENKAIEELLQDIRYAQQEDCGDVIVIKEDSLEKTIRQRAKKHLKTLQPERDEVEIKADRGKPKNWTDTRYEQCPKCAVNIKQGTNYCYWCGTKIIWK